MVYIKLCHNKEPPKEHYGNYSCKRIAGAAEMQSVLGHRSEVLWWVDPTMSKEERPKLRCSGLHLESRGPNFSYKQGHDRIPI